ncbi:MAG: molybdopterin oxidoreductase family protein [Thermodesulfobacteriota bacterium]
MDYFRSVCPHDCPDACGLLVGVEDGKALSVKGDPDHPFTKGAVCVKMAHYPERQASPHRVLHPLRRTGPKGSGQFARVSWDQALDEIVERYQKIIAQHGAEAILPYSYAGTMGRVHYHAGHAFFHKLGASKLLRTMCSAAHEAGFKASLGPMTSADLETAPESDLIIIWGNNTISTNMHAWPLFLETRKKGAPLIVIDPYCNRTARQADRHLRLRPGTDAALALGLMHVLIKEDLLDHGFLRDWTVGFEELKNRAAEYSPERVEKISGVPAAEIEKLARDYGRAKAPFLRLGWGPGRQLRGGMAVRTICLLPALVGAFHKNGGCFTRSVSVGSALNLGVITREDLSPAGVRTINMVELGHALTTLTDPPVKALHVYQTNPAVVAPDSGRVLAGLKREDLFTVVHEHFLTETAWHADLVLPGATCLESTDLYPSYGHYYLQMTRPVVPPRGEARPPLAIFQDLARRFGFTEDVFTASEEELIRRLIPEGHPWFEGLTLEKLSEGKPLRVKTPPNPFRDGFATPSGKVEFYSESLAAQGLDPLPDGTPSVDTQGQGRYPLQMITPPRHQFLNSTFNEVDYLREQAGPPTIKIHPVDATARGIADRDEVRVHNDRGEVFLSAEVTADASPGVTVVEGLYWPRFMPGGKGINHLTSQALTDLGRSCAFHGSLVEVEKI